jgi:hypothetical protein
MHRCKPTLDRESTGLGWNQADADYLTWHVDSRNVGIIFDLPLAERLLSALVSPPHQIDVVVIALSVGYENHFPGRTGTQSMSSKRRST